MNYGITFAKILKNRISI